MLLQKSGESSLSLLEPLSGSIRFIDEDSRVALSISEPKSHVNDGFVLEEEESLVQPETPIHHCPSSPVQHYQQHKTCANSSKIKANTINFRPPTPPPRADKSLSCYKENIIIGQIESSNAKIIDFESIQVQQGQSTPEINENEDKCGVDNNSFRVNQVNSQSFKALGNDLI